MALSSRSRDLLRCPCCGASLRGGFEQLQCVNQGCATVFPVLGGVPILLNETHGLFGFQDHREQLARPIAFRAKAARFLKRLVPDLTANVSGVTNCIHLVALLQETEPTPLVLLIGGGTLGVGTSVLAGHPRIELLETDIVIDERTKLACDAHNLPFADQSFDCVVMQAVMEYLQDPFRCASEIHRVLKPHGIVYSEAPFLLPVHGRDHDFMRFTHVGHRRLYAHFSELSSGACGGPASSLACSIQYFALSCIPLTFLRDVVKTLVRYAFFWLKYLDYVLANSRAGLDAAAGTYFLGRKSGEIKSDRDILLVYKGAGTIDGVFQR